MGNTVRDFTHGKEAVLPITVVNALVTRCVDLRILA
jgi:hypothetical protein